jgi:hypothetical protein
MPSRSLGPYEILSASARRDGQVNRAHDSRLGATWRSNCCPSSGYDAGLLGYFPPRGRAASALNHLNICTIHDMGEHEAAPIVMELWTARRWSKSRRFGARRSCLDFALQLAGLDAAHAKGIIHRDIKPGNIVIRRATW